ncbi:MAG: glutamate--tRNA ligase, partial [Acidimicrobiales bacterium]
MTAPPPPPPRVRFAPSPTGFFHVGSARTALVNWLFARRQGGVFVLRIEDTDAERNREEWVDGILSAMAWLGMEPDEGPYRQSARAERHRVAVDALWEGGFLYACDCTRQDVLARTEGNAIPGYDGHCRDRGLDRVGPDGAGVGGGRALRFRTPHEGETVVEDLVRGTVTFPNAAMEDFVAVTSAGRPLFVLANVIDDRDMGITHVIRGEDLLPTTPKGLLLWQALDEAAEGEAGWGEVTAVPAFAHLPMLVNEQGKKLSKRRDPVSVERYRDQGYLPEAFRNYLALLGWSPAGDREKVGVEVLVEEFRLEDVHHAPAQFDVRKLTHLNGEYIRELPVAEFVARSRPWLEPERVRAGGGWTPSVAPGPAGGAAPSGGAGEAGEAGEAYRPPWPPERFSEGTFEALAPLVQERVARLDQVAGMVDFVFLADPPVDAASWEKAVARDDGAGAILAAAADAYTGCEWTVEALREAAAGVAEAAGRKLGKAQAPIRVAVTGRTVGPPLFESLAVLGREEVLRRLRSALARERAGDGGNAGGPPAAGGPPGRE